MPRHFTPEESKLEPAKRLMSCAEIESIRLVEGRFAYTPAHREDVKGRKGGALQISVDLSARGKLAHPRKLNVGIRFSLTGRKDSEKSKQLLIGAKFELIYTVPPGIEPSEGEIDAFANTNALLNVWPFWREFVHSSINRMGLPPLTLPLFRMAASSTEKRVRSRGARSSAES